MKDDRSYAHFNSCDKKVWKKIRPEREHIMYNWKTAKYKNNEISISDN